MWRSFKIKLLLALLFCVHSAMAQNIYMVSVGIADYQYINDLRKAENDAREMAKLYGTHTKNITLLTGSQATHDGIKSALVNQFSKAQPNDIVVFFFSGHGMKGGLCAYDVNLRAEHVLLYSEIQQVLRSCKAKTKLLFIDACFSGGLRDTKKRSSAQQSFNGQKGIMLFLSSRTGETSQENPWANYGFYTQYLVRGIKGAADVDKDRIITAKEIYEYVSQNVKKATRQQQHPVMWGLFSDDMHIMNWNPKR